MDNTPNRIALIPLRDRTKAVIAHAIVDAADMPDVGRFEWCLNANGYAWRNDWKNRPRHVYLHRHLAGGKPGDGLYVDHVNRDKLDNRRANLRLLTPRESAQNKPSIGGTSSHRGVHWDAHRSKWAAHVQLDGIMHALGRFASEEEAAGVARQWRLEHMPATVEDIA